MVFIFEVLRSEPSGEKRIHAYALHPAGSGDEVRCVPVWTRTTRDDPRYDEYDGSAIVHQGLLHLNNRYLARVRCEDGALLAHDPTLQAPNGYAPNVIAGGYLFMFQQSGRCAVFDWRSGAKVAENTMGGRHPRPGRDLAAESSARMLQAVNDGILAWMPAACKELRWPAQGEVHGNPPAFSGRRMYVRTQTELFCIGE